MIKLVFKRKSGITSVYRKTLSDKDYVGQICTEGKFYQKEGVFLFKEEMHQIKAYVKDTFDDYQLSSLGRDEICAYQYCVPEDPGPSWWEKEPLWVTQFGLWFQKLFEQNL
jgi:hypothetical protein